MKITYYGHSCFGVEVMGKYLLFDPFITPNELAKNIDIQKIPADYILLSHGHGDHVADVVPIANNTRAQVIGVYEVVGWFQEKHGIENIMGMNTGGHVTLSENIQIKLINAVHSSSMPDGSYGGNPVGFVISSPEGTFYYAGDTALSFDMKLIPMEFSIDFAFLPIGDFYTMGINDAVQAAQYIETKQVIGMHYDTMPVIKIDRGNAIEAFQQQEIQLHLPSIGDSIQL
ncbi:metal-dependent hydrolase [Algivirga pacifica]|uniref:UPF0173 metal-dependent hydrolase GCM10023331_22940 n=1 Tax=Algivirga pacifica TaxID=1162670 RepID=A0ABP9DBP3_9BACT